MSTDEPTTGESRYRVSRLRRRRWLLPRYGVMCGSGTLPLFVTRRFLRALLVREGLYLEYQRKEIERLTRENQKLRDDPSVHRRQVDSDEIGRLRAALEAARTAILTVDDILAAARYAVDSSARNLLMCGCPDQALSDESDSAPETSERHAAREDRAYCEGAQQALAIAAQSWPAAEKWLREGCGNRRAQAMAVLSSSEKASGEPQL